jgi:hypothetical protein
MIKSCQVLEFGARKASIPIGTSADLALVTAAAEYTVFHA